MNLDRIIAVRNDKTVYHDGNLSIKAFRSTVPMSYILKEAFFLSVAAEVGLDVPALHSVVEQDGRWTLVSDYVKGRALDQIYAQNPTLRGEILSRFADLQVKILSKTYCGLPSTKGLVRARVEASSIASSVKTALLRNLEPMPEGDRLCHGDFTLSNVVQTDDGRLFTLDWSRACLGVGDDDAATTYLLLVRTIGEDAAKVYLEDYCRKAPTNMYAVNKWIPFIAAMRYAIGNRMDRDFYGRYFL